MWLKVSSRKPDNGSLCNKNLLSYLKQTFNYLLPKIEIDSSKGDYFIFLLHSFCRIPSIFMHIYPLIAARCLL